MVEGLFLEELEDRETNIDDAIAFVKQIFEKCGVKQLYEKGCFVYCDEP